MVCTFFGHKDTPDEIAPTLLSVLTDLIKNKNVNFFYVGNNGNFDYIVRQQLKKLKKEYPEIEYSVVLAYIPTQKKSDPLEDHYDTIIPDGIENTPPKYAIVKRNKWMIDKSDYVITYVKYNTGGAIQFKNLAQRKGKTVINLV